MWSWIARAAAAGWNWPANGPSARHGDSQTTVAGAALTNLSGLVIDEINLIGSRCGSFREAIRALTEKQIDVASLVHRRMKLEQGAEAMDLAGRPGLLKVILTME